MNCPITIKYPSCLKVTWCGWNKLEVLEVQVWSEAFWNHFAELNGPLM